MPNTRLAGKKSGSRRCFVTGMGIVSAAGPSVESFRGAIVTGRSLAREVDDLATPRFQPRIAVPIWDRPSSGHYGTGRRDPAHRLACTAVAEALAQAGLERKTLPTGVALVLGTTLGGAVRAQEWHRAHLSGLPSRSTDLVQAPLVSVADRVCKRFGLDGPRFVVSNACVSANDAQGMALDLIRSGEADLVIAGGVDTLHDFNFNGFASLGTLTRDRCDPFSKVDHAMVLGEAAAFVVLEAEGPARARGALLRAELSGYGAACDALHITAPSPEGDGAHRAICDALADAGLGPDAVDFVSLHGVGTRYMDAMEVEVMRRLFGDHARRVSATSLRPVTGHTLGGVGAVDTIASVLAMEDGFIPPTGSPTDGASTLPPQVHLARETAAARIDVALNTSTGFGGVSSALVLQRATDEA